MARLVNFNLAILLLIFLCFVPVPSASQNSTTDQSSGSGPGLMNGETVRLFTPTGDMIHSDQINDQINGPAGEVLFGTSFGLSIYNGTWRTLHRNRDNISQGLMDDYITALEYDNKGELWIGYSGGIQIFNGRYYQSIRDQQLLKETRIMDIQRWDNDMWIATGHAGIHRYREGNWTWFQPMTRDGPGFYEVHSMALDPATDHLFIATDHEGLWKITSPDDPVLFDQINGKDSAYGSLQQVRRDPLGGVYFFNASMVVHYDEATGFSTVVINRNLTDHDISINDVDGGPDGRLILATDDGIYILKDGIVARHLTRFEGIGTSMVVRTVRADSRGRIWFSTRGYVGYVEEPTDTGTSIVIEMATSPVETTPVVTTMVTPVPEKTPDLQPLPQPPPSVFPPDSFLHIFNPVVDPIARAVHALNITPG